MKYVFLLLGIIVGAIGTYFYLRPTPTPGPLPPAPKPAVTTTAAQVTPQTPRRGLTIQIAVTHPPRSAEATETDVTRILEEALLIDGLEAMHSESRPAGTTITLQLKPDQSLDSALPRVQNALTAAMPRLPADASPPTIQRDTQPPFLWLALDSTTRPLAELSRIASQFRDRLQTIPHVAAVKLRGAGRRVFNVKIDPQRLSALALDAADVADALRKSSGDLNQNGASALPGIVVAVRNGTPIRLSDIAQLADTWESDGRVRFNSKPAVALGISAPSGSSRDAIREHVHKLLLAFEVPDDVGVSTAIDYGSEGGTFLAVDVFAHSGEDATARALAALEQRIGELTAEAPLPLLAFQPDPDAPMDGTASLHLKVPHPSNSALAGELIEKISPAADQMSGVAVQVLRISTEGRPTRLYPVHLRLEGPDWDQLMRFSYLFAKRLETSSVARSVRLHAARAPEQRINIDRATATALRIEPQRVRDIFAIATSGLPLAEIRNLDGRSSLIVSIETNGGTEAASQRVRAVGDKLVPLSTVATIELSLVFSSIRRFNRRRIAEITATLLPRSTPSDLQTACDKIETEVRLELGLSNAYRAVRLDRN